MDLLAHKLTHAYIRAHKHMHAATKTYTHTHTHTHTHTYCHLHSIRYEAGDSDPNEWVAQQTYGKRGRYMNCSKVLYDALKTKILPAIAYSTALHAAALSSLSQLYQNFIDVATRNIDAKKLISSTDKMWTVPPEWSNGQAEASWDVAVADFKVGTAGDTSRSKALRQPPGDSLVSNAQSCVTKISETGTFLEREW